MRSNVWATYAGDGGYRDSSAEVLVPTSIPRFVHMTTQSHPGTPGMGGRRRARQTGVHLDPAWLVAGS